MSSVTLNSYNIPSIFVLVDSGSSNCFIDTTFVNEHAISTCSVPSIQLWLFDRTMNTTINYPNSRPLRPFQNWWHHSNDILCYSAGWLLFTCSRTQLACLLQSINWLGFGQYLIPLILDRTSRHPRALLSNLQTYLLLLIWLHPIHHQVSCQALPITIISAPAFFALACHLQGSLQLHPAKSDLHSTSTTFDDSDLSRIPPDYHKFTNVFSKTRADILAPHCKHDLKIDLEEGASPPISTTYSLSPSELESLWTFLDEHPTMSFIRPSSSAHIAPVLFIHKKNGSLCLCIGFRGLNKIMKKDRTPFPVSLTCWMFQAVPRSIARLISGMRTIWSTFLPKMSGSPHSAHAMAFMNG